MGSLAANDTWSKIAMELRDMLVTVQNVSISVCVLDTVLGVVFNVLLLVAVLSKAELRRDARNILLVNVAAGDLLVVVLEQPLTLANSLHPTWRYGCKLHIALQLITSFAFNFLSAWGIVCLDILLVLRVARCDVTSIMTSSMTTSSWTWRRRLERAVLVLAVVLPWVLSVVVVLPVVESGKYDLPSRIAWTSERCPLILTARALLALRIIFFFLPALAALVLLVVAAGMVLLQRRRAGRVMTITPDSTTAPSVTSDAGPPTASGHYLLPYVLGSALTFVLVGPRHVFYLLTTLRLPLVKWLEISLTVETLNEFKSSLLPLLWILAFPDLRARTKSLLAYAVRFVTCRTSNAAPFDASVSYTNMA
jgi:hypothetical protein